MSQAETFNAIKNPRANTCFQLIHIKFLFCPYPPLRLPHPSLHSPHRPALSRQKKARPAPCLAFSSRPCFFGAVFVWPPFCRVCTVLSNAERVCASRIPFAAALVRVHRCHFQFVFFFCASTLVFSVLLFLCSCSFLGTNLEILVLT